MPLKSPPRRGVLRLRRTGWVADCENKSNSIQSKVEVLARELRKNLTYGEARLWKYLKNKQVDGYDFHRQKPIDNYIVDFYSPTLGLIIEIDGGTHDESRYDNNLGRQKKLESFGLKILRFSEADVLKRLDDVLQSIELFIEETHPALRAPLRRGEES